MAGRPRLSARTLDHLPRQVGRPNYSRDRLVPGIVHFGPGAFHRAHQAAFVDAILADDPRWAISATALNSTAVAEALRPQDGLYTLVELGDAPRLRVVGSLVEVLTRHDGAVITARLAAPTTRLVTATVTEKGYALAADGTLDRDHPAVRGDLARPAAPTSFIGRLVRGLQARRDAGAGGLTVLSCDNLARNGARLRAAVSGYAAVIDPSLAGWIADAVAFPSSMVDSITPATDDALRARVAAAIDLDDAWPIGREPFAQWVIEDAFAGERPPLDRAGVRFVTSVDVFETAKLRLLNGAHSSLAYFGLLLGHETVAAAVADPALGSFVERLMRADIAPTLHDSTAGSTSYIDAVLARFGNPAIRHLLSQIAWDGSQKLPVRLLGTIADARRAGRPVDRLAGPLAAWCRFLRLPRPPAAPLVDPLATILAGLAARDDVAGALAVLTAGSPLAADSDLGRAVDRAFRAMADADGVRRWLAAA